MPCHAIELALVCRDPDAPNRAFAHWLVSSIAPSATRVAEDTERASSTIEPNDFAQWGWGGPHLPQGHGPHRYGVRAAGRRLARWPDGRPTSVTTWPCSRHERGWRPATRTRSAGGPRARWRSTLTVGVDALAAPRHRRRDTQPSQPSALTRSTNLRVPVRRREKLTELGQGRLVHGHRAFLSLISAS